MTYCRSADAPTQDEGSASRLSLFSVMEGMHSALLLAALLLAVVAVAMAAVALGKTSACETAVDAEGAVAAVAAAQVVPPPSLLS